MSTRLQQSTALRQELRINPRLYQAMDLLQMPVLELQQHLKQELLTNPFLEMVEPGDEELADDYETAEPLEDAAEATGTVAEDTSLEMEPEKSGDDDLDWESLLLDGFESGSRHIGAEERSDIEPVRVERRDLSDHLLEQIALLDLSARDQLLAEEFIGSIDDDGRLSASLRDIHDALNTLLSSDPMFADIGDPYSADEIERMLRVVQELDPPGIAARDLQECLRLQLMAQGLVPSLAAQLVDEGFDALSAHRWSDAARQFGVTVREIQDAADLIGKLDPKPGLRFRDGGDDYIVPDLTIDTVGEEYVVSLNDTQLPRLRVNRAYQQLLLNRGQLDAESREFIASKFTAAQWMLQAIEQRRQTMLKVTSFIVTHQREFFERGVQSLRPLTLRDVADAVGMHESTISRVTSEKYVQTPRGVLPLRYFFSAGLSSASGDDVSARGIQDQIAKLVASANAHAPLTDQAIVEILGRRGVSIARRTVAKYREQLGILSARMRRRV